MKKFGKILRGYKIKTVEFCKSPLPPVRLFCELHVNAMYRFSLFQSSWFCGFRPFPARCFVFSQFFVRFMRFYGFASVLRVAVLAENMCGFRFMVIISSVFCLC